jgi:hypothetical protein
LAKFTAVSMGALVLSMLVLISTGCFGAAQAGNMVNPGLQLVRLIHVGDYFERTEVIWMAIAIGAGIMMAVNAVWIFSLGIAQMMGLDTYKPLVYPTALLSYILALTSFSDNTASGRSL